MIYTARLQLRPLELSDATFILELLNEASFLRYIGDRKVRTLADAERYLSEGPIAMQAKEGHSLWRVAIKSSRPIGLCGLLKRPELPEPDLGFALFSAYEGMGYALEAAKIVLADCDARFGFPRILAIVQPDNTRSLGLLDKLGFVDEGTHKDLRLLVRTKPEQLRTKT
jgi:RimJ/RimL family protein N-acetyltransferase